MRAFVVLGLVFFSHQAKRLAWENVSEITYFVSTGTLNHNSVSQSLSVGWQEGHVAGKSDCASYLQRPKMLVGVIVAAGLARILTMTFCLR